MYISIPLFGRAEDEGIEPLGLIAPAEISSLVTDLRCHLPYTLLTHLPDAFSAHALLYAGFAHVF